MVTRPADAAQVPQPGEIKIVAKLFGTATEPVMLAIDDGAARPMEPSADGAGTGRVTLDAGMHRVVASIGSERDIPRRGIPVAPGRDIHSIGLWPEHGIAGTQLGANKDGKHW